VPIEVAPRNAPADLVSHQVYLVPALRKRALLTHLIRSRDMRQVLIFVRMKRDANRLARQIEQDGIVTQAIHSDRTQAERMQALDEFKQGKVTALVATDIAARGLDIEQLPFVINYELPHTPEDYVHRIGRTGRAGLPGEAISLVARGTQFLEDIETLKRSMARATAAGMALDAPCGRGHDASTARRVQRSRAHGNRPGPAAGVMSGRTPPAPANGKNSARLAGRPHPAVDASGLISQTDEPAAASPPTRPIRSSPSAGRHRHRPGRPAGRSASRDK
jgi:ATP-dependent RNA helicase RhlE